MRPVVLFAGGGTGGHIYPNVAIAERLAECRPELGVHFLVSDRPGDAQILDRLGHRYTASPVRPLPSRRRPWQVVGFLLAWRRAVAAVTGLLAEHRVAAVVATGGYVSGPAVVAAARRAVPRALINLDAVPGQANRSLAPRATQMFSVFATTVLPGAVPIGLPLRAASHGTGTPAEARAALGLARDRPLLFITGATHGAGSIIAMLIAWCEAPALRRGLDGWQVLHQCGSEPAGPLERAYAAAGITATVVASLDRIGLAFRAADLAIARAGAGTVAEVWANATPTVFLPNPYHSDEHQRHNARPLVELGGAIIVPDRIEPAANLASTVPAIIALLGARARRDKMRAALAASPPPDGAATVAEWIARVIGS